MDKKKVYIVKNSNGEVHATTLINEGQSLVTLEELQKKENEWLFNKLPNSIFVVKE